MGLSPFKSKSHKQLNSGRLPDRASFGPQAPDPNPRKFTLRQKLIIGNVLVVRINYEGCTTHQGDKVLVYDDRDKFHVLLGSGCVDPHFLETSYSPIARFEATDRGWDHAVRFANMISSDFFTIDFSGK